MRRSDNRSALNYQIVVNWVIAEHKSQGLFQRDCGRHDLEEFWVLGGDESGERLHHLWAEIGGRKVE